MSRHSEDPDEVKRLERDYVAALTHLQNKRIHELESALSSPKYLACDSSPDPLRYITWARGELSRMELAIDNAVPVKVFSSSMAEVAILCAMAAGEYKARALDCVNDD